MRHLILWMICIIIILIVPKNETIETIGIIGVFYLSCIYEEIEKIRKK